MCFSVQFIKHIISLIIIATSNSGSLYVTNVLLATQGKLYVTATIILVLGNIFGRITIIAMDPKRH